MRKFISWRTILLVVAALGAIIVPTVVAAAAGGWWQDSVVVPGHLEIIEVRETTTPLIGVYTDKALTTPLDYFRIKKVVFQDPIDEVLIEYPRKLYVKNESTLTVMLAEPCNVVISDDTLGQVGGISATMFTAEGKWLGSVCGFNENAVITPGTVVVLEMSVWFTMHKGEPTPPGRYDLELPIAVIVGN